MKGLKIRESEYTKMMHWVNQAKGEVGGMGTIKFEDGYPIVERIYLLKQKCTSAETDIPPEEVGRLAFELMEANDTGYYNFWWHSHGNGGVFWSGQDIKQQKEFAQAGFFYSLVVNKKEEYRAAYNHNVKHANGEEEMLFHDNLSLEIIEDTCDMTTEVGKIQCQIEDLEARLEADIQRLKNSYLPKFRPLVERKDAILDELSLAWTKEFEDKVTESTYTHFSFYNNKKNSDNSSVLGLEYPIRDNFTSEEDYEAAWDVYMEQRYGYGGY